MQVSTATSRAAASPSPEVVLLTWPADDRRRAELAASGVARLLLIGVDDELPAVVDPLEDWIRVPADERDLYARIRRLAALATARQEAAAQAARLAPRLPAPPVVDDEDLIHVGDRWAALPEAEARLARLLVADFGRLVRRDHLAAVLLRGDEASRVVDMQVHRLRQRIAPLGLTISSVRSRGYVLAARSGVTDPSKAEDA
jgi:DNA-binding response OmpR family regulator